MVLWGRVSSISWPSISPIVRFQSLNLTSNSKKKAQEKLNKWIDKDSKKGSEPVPSIEKIRFFSDFKSLTSKSYELLLETATENLEIKKKIFQEFDTFSNSESMIASNTSSISITSMAREVSQEKRSNVVGLHFFNPPTIMTLLEIIQAEETSQKTIEAARALGESLKKKTVVCKDAPGFITSRLGIVALNEAIFALQEGLSTAEEIDCAMKLGYNHPMGPLQLADFIGLDVVFSITQTLYENYQDTKYRPALLLRKKIEANHLGRKTGRGFYVYER